MDRGAESYRRFLEGDDGGFAEIVETYKDGLILFLHAAVKDLYLAEELAEDAFFRLLVKKPRFSGRSSFRSFLYAIGRNIAADEIRRNVRKREKEAEEAGEALTEAEDLERSVIRKERRAEVRAAIGRLPSDYRQILWLSYFEELTNAECALVMKKTDRQVRNLLYRAKQSLKKELEKEGYPDEEF